MDIIDRKNVIALEEEDLPSYDLELFNIGSIIEPYHHKNFK